MLHGKDKGLKIDLPPPVIQKVSMNLLCGHPRVRTIKSITVSFGLDIVLPWQLCIYAMDLNYSLACKTMDRETGDQCHAQTKQSISNYHELEGQRKAIHY